MSAPFRGGIIKLTEMRGTTPVYVNYDIYYFAKKQ